MISTKIKDFPLASLTALFLVGFLSLSVNAQVYKWVDDEGNIHFGDEIPQEYESAAEEAELAPINTVSMKTPASGNAHPLEAWDQRQFPSSENIPTNYPTYQPEHQSCDAQWKAFRESESCFSMCYAGSGTRNQNNCRCRNLARPSC